MFRDAADRENWETAGTDFDDVRSLFSDSDAGEPGFIRLEPHASNCSYADRNSIHGRGRECAKHWMGNNRGDALFLPAVLAAKVACAGRFDWLLVGDDDTHFCSLKLHSLLRPHVPTTPWYFGGRLDCAGEHCVVNATATPRRASALAACPALVGGPPRRIRLGGLKVVIDCAHGAAYHVAPMALWELGANVIPVGVDPNGFNINDGCGSTQPQSAAEAVVANQEHT